MDMKTMMKAAEDYKLREPLTLEELFDIMQTSNIAFPGQFKITKGVFGKAIVFDTFAEVKPRITVKDKTVKVRKTETNTGSTIPSREREEGLRINLTEAAHDIKTMKEGGFDGLLSGHGSGPEYFNNVCDRMRELLQDRIEG